MIDAHTQLRIRTAQVVEVPEDVCKHDLIVTGSSDGFLQLWNVYEESNQLLCEVKTSERITCCTSLRK